MTLIYLTLATWRLASLLASERGPWDVCGKLRHLLGVRYDTYGQPVTEGELAKMVTCVWCNSLWIGAGWVGLAYLLPAVAFWLALPFALSALAIILNGVIEWLEHQSQRS